MVDGKYLNWIQAALDKGGNTSTLEDIDKGIRMGAMQLWLGETCCGVTEIVVFPQKKVLNIFLAGGDLEGLKDMEHDVVKWAKRHGCQELWIQGRVGWSRKLKDDGWTTSHVVMSKEI